MVGILTETIGLKHILRDGIGGDKTQNSWTKGKKGESVIVLSTFHSWKGKPLSWGRNLELFMW